MTLTMYDLISNTGLDHQAVDLHEQLAQIERAERAEARRLERDRDERALLDAWIDSIESEIEAAHARAAEYHDLTVASSTKPEREYWTAEYDAAVASVAKWEAVLAGDTPVRAGQDITPASFWRGGLFDMDGEDEGDPELPEPEQINELDYTEEAWKRLYRTVSNAQHWAYEEQQAWTLVGGRSERRFICDEGCRYRDRAACVKAGHRHHYKLVTVHGQVKQKRSYPGQHIIGALGNESGVALGREAIITYWSRKAQQWVLVRAHEGPRENGFTQWLPHQAIRVPTGRLLTWRWDADTGEATPVYAEPDDELDRASLDNHTGRATRNLDLALRWAWVWASQVRAEHAEPDASDGASRRWFTDAQ